jgi:hypothetical protein
MFQVLFFSMDYNSDLIVSFITLHLGQSMFFSHWFINVSFDFPLMIGLPSIVSMSHVGVFL